jgi:DNA-binding PadR family transcriptional regulator
VTGSNRRLTLNMLRLLRIFLDDIERERAGSDLTKATGIASGNLYPLLRTLESRGILASRWEDGDPATLGRPLRRFYKITKIGKREARRTFAELGIKS